MVFLLVCLARREYNILRIMKYIITLLFRFSGIVSRKSFRRDALRNYMRKLFLILLLSLCVAPPVFAVEIPINNSGFSQSNIWYSKDPFFAGDKIRIYTIVFNGSAQNLAGAVLFLDNGIQIGKRPFSISSGDSVQDVWVDWTAKDGKHTITAQIIEVSTIDAFGKKRIVVLENSETGKSELQVDFDTDGDSIGNTDDLDDDNDSVLDIDEVKNGSDPLKKDTDGNGVSDSKELEIVAARAIADLKKYVATSTEALGAIENTIKTINDAIPVPVKAMVASSTNTIERFRVGEGYQFRLAKEAKIKEIAVLRAKEYATTTKAEVKSIIVNKDESAIDTVSNTAEKPFAYVMLAGLTLLQYLFEWKVVFYGVILYTAYRIIKWIVRRFRDR